MAPPPRITRVKKLLKSQGQAILREDQVEDYDSASWNEGEQKSTGVEAHEEKVSHMILT